MYDFFEDRRLGSSNIKTEVVSCRSSACVLLRVYEKEPQLLKKVLYGGSYGEYDGGY